MADNEFTLTRVFDAPPAEVFEAWLDQKELSHWFGPKMFTVPVCEVDARIGGEYRIIMRSPDGVDYPITGEYQKIKKPELIVMTMDCSEHPKEWHDMVKPDRAASETNPAGIMLTTVTFIPAGSKTTLTLKMRFESKAIHDALVNMGMESGWSESFDRLADLIAGR